MVKKKMFKSSTKNKLTSGREKSNLLLENENLKLKLRIEKMKNKRLLKEGWDDSSDLDYLINFSKIKEPIEFEFGYYLPLTDVNGKFDKTIYEIDNEEEHPKLIEFLDEWVFEKYETNYFGEDFTLEDIQNDFNKEFESYKKYYENWK